MELLISWLVLTLAIWVTAEILPGVHVKSFGSTFAVAAIYGVLNVLIGWLLFTVFAIATLGLGLVFAFATRWVVNAILLTITDSISDTLKIDSFGWALGAAAMMSVIGTLGEMVIGRIF